MILKILQILKDLMIVVDCPKSRPSMFLAMNPTQAAITITKSKVFQPSLKKSPPKAMSLIVASMVYIILNTKLIYSSHNFKLSGSLYQVSERQIVFTIMQKKMKLSRITLVAIL